MPSKKEGKTIGNILFVAYIIRNQTELGKDNQLAFSNAK